MKTTPLISLPAPVANCSGAIVNAPLYIAGGIEQLDATETSKPVWRFDFGSKPPRWTGVATWAGGGRMFAVAAGLDGAFWLIGGVELNAAKDGARQHRYLTDAYRYDPAGGWRRLPDSPHSVVAAPSLAPVDGQSIILLGVTTARRLVLRLVATAASLRQL